jgi:hypothetical protein
VIEPDHDDNERFERPLDAAIRGSRDHPTALPALPARLCFPIVVGHERDLPGL